MSVRRTERHARSRIALLALLLSSAAVHADRVELPNGDVYEGDVERGARSGSGVYVWADGNRYEGEFSEDKMHGRGVYYWPDGRSYQGDFQQDMRHGSGVLRWPNGDVYSGEFAYDQMAGKGRFQWANQDLYEGDFVAVAPGSVWATKRWTERGFSELARWAVAQRVVVVLVGTAGERDLCERVRTHAGHRVINLAGRTSPAELAAILELSSALLGNDSGPGHLAVAVGTPVVAIFGPTDPSRGFRPLGDRVLTVDLGTSLACRPCSVHGSHRCPRGHHRCMNDLQPADVIARIEAWPLNPLTQSPDRPRAPRG